MRIDLGDPLLLDSAADHQEEHEMADFMIQNMMEQRATTEFVKYDPALSLNELCVGRSGTTPGRRHATGLVDDLPQAAQVIAGQDVDRRHDVSDRNQVLLREPRDR